MRALCCDYEFITFDSGIFLFFLPIVSFIFLLIFLLDSDSDSDSDSGAGGREVGCVMGIVGMLWLGWFGIVY